MAGSGENVEEHRGDVDELHIKRKVESGLMRFRDRVMLLSQNERV
jgi:hypothetical protein